MAKDLNLSLDNLSSHCLLKSQNERHDDNESDKNKSVSVEESSVENACAPCASCSTSDEHKKSSDKPTSTSIVKRTRFRRFFERFIVLIKISF